MGLTFDDATQPATQQGTLNFGLSSSNVPATSVPVRAAKADYVLGSASPGIPALSTELQTSGDGRIQQWVRDQAQTKYDLAKANVVTNILATQQGPVTPAVANFVQNLSQQGFQDYSSSDPMSKAYAQKVIYDTVANDPSHFQKAETSNPEVTHMIMDQYQDGIEKNEFTHNLIDQTEQENQDQGFFGRAEDFAQSFIPFGTSVRTNFRVKGAPYTLASILPGNNLQTQIDYLHSLPPEQFKQKLTEAASSISNISVRQQFLQAVLQNSDFDNLNRNVSAVNDAAVILGPIGELAKGEMAAKAAGKAADTAAVDAARVVPGTTPNPAVNVPNAIINDSRVPDTIANDNNNATLLTTRNPDTSYGYGVGANDNRTDGPRPVGRGSEDNYTNRTSTSPAVNDNNAIIPYDPNSILDYNPSGNVANKTQTLSDQVISKIQELAGQNNGVNLDKVRAAFPNTPKKDLDQVFGEILQGQHSGINLLAHDDPKQITPAMKEAAYNPGGQDFHTAWNSRVPDQTVPAPVNTSTTNVDTVKGANRNNVPGQKFVKNVDQPVYNSVPIQPDPNVPKAANNYLRVMSSNDNGQDILPLRNPGGKSTTVERRIVSTANDNIANASRPGVDVNDLIHARADNDNHTILKDHSDFQQYVSQLDGALNASKDRVPDVARYAEMTGDNKNAAVITAMKPEENIPGETTVRNSALHINDGYNKFFNGMPANFARESIQRMLDKAQAGQTAAGKFLDAVSIPRDSADNSVRALQATYDNAIRDLPHALQGSLIDVDSTHHALTNTETMSMYFGQKNGELFPNVDAATTFAKQNFPKLTLYPEVRNGSVILRLDQDVPDAIDAIKSLAIDPDNTFSNSVLNSIIGSYRNQKSVLGQENSAARIGVQHGRERLQELFNEISKPLTQLNTKEATELNTILSQDRDYVDNATSIRGYRSQTVEDLSQRFVDHFDHLPSEKQISAYYANLQLEDLDYTVRAASPYTNLIRQGARQFDDTYTNVLADGTRQKTPLSFKGKYLDELPIQNKDYEFRVGIKDPDTGEIRVKLRKYLDKDDFEDIKKIQENGGKIIQTSDQATPVMVKNDEKHIGFLVTSSPQESPLKMEFSYRPGGHVANDATHYLKQPIIKDGVYVGDTAVAAFRSGRLGKDVEKAWATAVQKMKENAPDFNSFVSKNIGEGMDGQAFRNMYRDNGALKALDLDQPVKLVKAGQHVGALEDMKFADRDIVDSVHNPYNMNRNMDRNFTGQRDAQNIMAIDSEKGVRKVYQDGRLLDPYATMGKAARSMIDLRGKRDYLIKSANEWVNRYKDVLDPSWLQIKQSPIDQMLNPVFRDGINGSVTHRNAMNVRQSLLRFTGMNDGTQTAMDTIKAHVADWIYNKTGKDLATSPNWMLPFVKDPAMFARSVAAHAKLGLFNPIQYPLQAQTVANVLALSPKAGAKAVGMYFPMRAALVNPVGMDALRGFARSMGWKNGEADEMMDALLRSGWHSVHGTYSSLDTIENPKVISKGVSKFLDAGMVFFNEGERVNRLTSWATAYQEWKARNLEAKLTDRDILGIQSRADDLTVNMSAANNAVWQKGLAAIPFQFFSYQGRLMEQYLSHGGGAPLNFTDKARLLATHAALFGLPTAVGGVVGVWPIYDSVKSYLLDNNIPHDDTVVKSVLEGIPELALKAISGDDYNVGQRYGVGGMSLFRDILFGDKNKLQTLLGASGSVLGDIVGTSIPVIKGMGEAITDDPNGIYPLDAQTFALPLKDVSSINNAYRLWYGLNYHQWLNKYNVPITNVTDGQAWTMSALGVNLESIQDSYLKSDLIKDHRQGVMDMMNHAQDLFRKGWNETDPVQRQQYMSQARASLILSGATPQEVTKATSQALHNLPYNKLDIIERNFQQDQEARSRLTSPSGKLQ